MKGNKKGALDRNALGIWMMLASMLILVGLYACFSWLIAGDTKNEVEDTSLELEGEYTLINFIRTPAVPEEVEGNDEKSTLMNAIHEAGFTFGDLIDVYIMEDRDVSREKIREIFLKRAKATLNPSLGMKEDYVRGWDLDIQYSDGTQFCHKECYEGSTEGSTKLDVYAIILPTRKKDVTAEIRLKVHTGKGWMPSGGIAGGAM